MLLREWYMLLTTQKNLSILELYFHFELIKHIIYME